MYRTMIVECQTKTANPNCEDCIAYKTCAVNRNLDKLAEVVLVEQVQSH